MRILTGSEELEAAKFIDFAAEIAKLSSCYRSRCGSVIVKESSIIGKGYNSPPLNKRLEYCLKDSLPADFRSDRTCCIHAEQRAIMDALQHHPEKIKDSRLYFIRLDEQGDKLKAGKPYCTICSKMTLDAGIAEFTLWHEEGICVYGAEEYNGLSFQYQG